MKMMKDRLRGGQLFVDPKAGGEISFIQKFMLMVVM